MANVILQSSALTPDQIASIVAASQPSIRLMRESSTSTTLSASDGGIICTVAGITVTLDSYSAAQAGNVYNVKNASSGDVTVITTSGEFIQESSGSETSMVIPSGFSLQFIRNGTDTTKWVIQ